MRPSGLLDPRDARPSRRAALERWLTLQRHLGLEPVEATRDLLDHGDAAGVLAARGIALLPHTDLERARAALEASRAQGVPFASRAYPARLRELSDAPPLLWVRGDVGLLGARAVAIVGARAATGPGRATAHALAAALARAGRLVISGLARGIDAAAHRGALDAGGATLALLGCGIDRLYPRDHRDLAQAMLASGGAIVSEFFPGAAPRAAHFPLRNRLISRLADAVVVVEGRLRSGSLVTARLAAEQGVEVLAVPGPIQSPVHRGTNQLIYEGAIPVLGVEETLIELGCDLPAKASRVAPRPAQLGADARAVLAALTEEPASTDELARRLQRPPAALAPALVELELSGCISEERDGRWLAVLR